MSDTLRRIKRAIEHGNYVFSEKAAIEMVADGITEHDVATSIHYIMQITDEDRSDSSPQIEAMRLTIAERRRPMAQQAEAMAPYYFQTSTDRQDWQAGDFNNNYQKHTPEVISHAHHEN